MAAVFNYVLILYRSRGVNRLWVLPLAMVAWANLHGGFAIGFMLRYLRTRSLTIFVVYRLVLAAVVIVVWLR